MNCLDPVILEISTGLVTRSEAIESLREMLSMAEKWRAHELGCATASFPDGHTMLDHLDKEGLPAPLLAPGREVPSLVQRDDDMGSGRLELLRQEDGDWIVTIYGEDFAGRHMRCSIEFCTPITGGGASPMTWDALTALAVAMESDTENPKMGGRAEHLKF